MESSEIPPDSEIIHIEESCIATHQVPVEVPTPSVDCNVEKYSNFDTRQFVDSTTPMHDEIKLN